MKGPGTGDGGQDLVGRASPAAERRCDLHRPGAVYVGRCIYFEARLGQEHCNNKNGPLFCPTGGRNVGPSGEIIRK